MQPTTAPCWGHRVLLAGLLLLAAVLRLWDLGGGPDPLDVDEGYAGVDALRVLAGHPTLYFAANNGAEPLHVYLAALTTALLGPSALALRLPAALAGVASVLATYLLVRTVFRDAPGGGPPAAGLALLVAFLQAVSLWHLHLSRDGSRVVLLPLLATLAGWCLWQGLRPTAAGGRAAAWCVAAGADFGLAPYTYLPARLLPLVALALVAYRAAARPGWPRDGWRRLGLAALTVTLVAAPLAVYYAAHRSAFSFRVEMVALTNPWVHQGDPWGLLARNLLGTAGMFAVRGDLDPQYNVDGQPVFPPPLAALAVVGLGLALPRWRQPAYGLWLAWLGLMLLPGVLSANAPHFARQVGIIPAVYVFPALGAWWLWHRGAGGWRRSVRAAVVLALLSGAGAAVYTYFARPPAPGPMLLARLATLPPAAEVYVAGSEETALVGSYLSGLGPRPRFTQGYHSLLLPRDPARTLYLVEQEWWGPIAEQLLAARYVLTPVPAPPSLERFRVLRLAERPGLEPAADPAAPWAPLSPAGWAVGIRLVGYGLPAAARPGEIVGVTLRWRVVAPAPDDPGQDYTFAVGLVDAAGEEVASRDWLGHSPAAWRDGDEVVSWFDLCLPATLPPGPLQATVALYSRADFVRRPLLDPMGHVLGDHLTFGHLPVEGAAQDPPCAARVHPALPPE